MQSAFIVAFWRKYERQETRFQRRMRIIFNYNCARRSIAIFRWLGVLLRNVLQAECPRDRKRLICILKLNSKGERTGLAVHNYNELLQMSRLKGMREGLHSTSNAGYMQQSHCCQTNHRQLAWGSRRRTASIKNPTHAHHFTINYNELSLMITSRIYNKSSTSSEAICRMHQFLLPEFPSVQFEMAKWWEYMPSRPAESKEKDLIRLHFVVFTTFRSFIVSFLAFSWHKATKCKHAVHLYHSADTEMRCLMADGAPHAHCRHILHSR